MVMLETEMWDVISERNESAVKRASSEEAVQAGRCIGIEIPGERAYLERVFEVQVEVPDKELIARGWEGSEGAEDIEIDPDWAE
ncbi:hypothetical protein EYZ11_008348 [Aspergillus tanneri]|uniref:Uncharacterized protein n=1 Tax=Aspergillus tanneri TaxID=1220188 RepID=A0A4S3JAP1_9EURO|nr:uncharacterized protein ATNIH1004_008499 [Aspergillus tanneri]KAA8644298.1 hypothetical protein ATNIH1004_008499 [Aspergillus tanneri]THC92189.1 hypothetical protein EYZ11_008348 [Aspergillus tanneri]